MRQLPESENSEQGPAFPAQLARAAVQPIRGGRAPGTAPIAVLSQVTLLSGV